MIKTNIKFTNITSENEVIDYINKKIEKVAKLIEPQKDEIIFRIEVGKTTDHHQSGNVYRAEMQVYVLGKDFRAEEVAEDIYSAIDLARDELWRSIKNEKDKADTLVRKGGRLLKKLLRRA